MDRHAPAHAGAGGRSVRHRRLVGDEAGAEQAAAELSHLREPAPDPPGLPNLHVAVVSSDMGAGDGTVPTCNAERGKKGIFQHTARGACADTTLKGGAAYIENANGVANYTGNIEDVFACIAALGDMGCEFAHPFAALDRALGTDYLGAAPAENAGFLRADAILAVVLLANEDDCSASPSSGSPNGEIPLFDTGNEQAHLVAARPARILSLQRVRPPLQRRHRQLHPPEPQRARQQRERDGQLWRVPVERRRRATCCGVVDTANRLKSLKANPAQVAVIDPGAVHAVHRHVEGAGHARQLVWRGVMPVAADRASCTASDEQLRRSRRPHGGAGRAVRRQRLVLPICDDDFAPSMDLAATLLKSRAVAPCLPGPIGWNAAGTAADCKVTEHYATRTGRRSTRRFRPAPTTATWHRVGSCKAACPPAFTGDEVMPDPDVPQSGSETFTYDCAKCVAWRRLYELAGAATAAALLDGDPLRQVARLVDVVALGQRDRVAHELQRQHGQERLQRRRRFGDVQPGRGPEGPRNRGQARLTEGSLSAETSACSSCRPPVAQTTRIHRISANLTRPLPPRLENAKSP